MKKILFHTLMVLIIAVMAVGCKKHTVIDPDPNPIDTLLRVGNIYCKDGRVIDPYTYNAQGMTNAIGVIFWVNDSLDVEDRAYVVSLHDSWPCFWCDTMISTGVSTSITAFDGAANTSTLKTFELRYEHPVYPMRSATQYSDEDVYSWYLPSVAQLTEIFRNKDEVYHAFSNCNGDRFNSIWYWSSTEDNDGPESKKYNAYIVTLKEGNIQAASKMDRYAVRPIKTIK